jgi:proline dehydrogenase
MGVARSMLLWASGNGVLRRTAPRLWFVRRAVRKFMPGEELADALDAAERFAKAGIPALITHLGEAITNPDEARAVADHYLRALEEIDRRGLDVEVSPKLSQLGFDVDVDLSREGFERVVRAAAERGRWVWIDMEAKEYVGGTLDVYRRALEVSPDVGLCLQAYLHRTPEDLEALLPHGPSIRLVKGAYREPKEHAIQDRGEIDEAYLRLARRILEALRDGAVRRFGAATHDVRLLGRVATDSRELGIPVKDWETQMLYGIRQAEQYRLAERGYPVKVLIAYGPAWYPWYVRRLAEKPGENLIYVARNVFAATPR